MAQKFYTTGQAARAAGISRQTLYAWMAEGKVTLAKMIGNTRVWSELQVKELRALPRKGRGRKPRKKEPR